MDKITPLLVVFSALVLLGTAGLTILKAFRLRCPHCGEAAGVRLTKSTKGERTIETLNPERFTYARYQETYYCEGCQKSFTRIRILGKNKQGTFG